MSVFFYSKNCSNCLDFFKKLKEEDMLKYFDEYFCVDGRQTLPTFLHSIPTIIVEDADTPLVGDDAFGWLKYKLDEKYKKSELGTLDSGLNFVSLDSDPSNINLDSADYISIHNIDKPLKPDMASTNFDGQDVNKQFEELQQERSQLLQEQKGPIPKTPNFERR